MNTLPNIRWFVVRSVLAVGMFLPAVATAYQDNPRGKSFVLIRSASGDETVQECRVARENNGYTLEVRENARVWLPQERVLCIAKSMVEIYRFRKQRVPVWNSGDHLQMGRWCLRHDLIDEASEHYLAIPAHVRSHPSVAQFGQAMTARMLADDAFRQFLGVAPLPTKTRLAAVESSESAGAAAVVTASSEDSTLDISPAAKARFYSRVQPILKNRCSQAACHGFRGKSEFRLYEPYGQSFNRIAESNLLSTAKHASRNAGSDTPVLLEYATSAHGVQRSPGVKPNETALINELLVWCNLIASPVISADGQSLTSSSGVEPALATQNLSYPGTSAALHPATLHPVDPGQSALRSVPLSPPGTGQQPDGAAPSSFPQGAAPPAMAEIDQLEQELNRILGEAAPNRTAEPNNDPFDASAFNNLPR